MTLEEKIIEKLDENTEKTVGITTELREFRSHVDFRFDQIDSIVADHSEKIGILSAWKHKVQAVQKFVCYGTGLLIAVVGVMTIV